MDVIEPTAERTEELRKLLQLTPEEVIARAGEQLTVYDDLDALHRALAEDMASQIESARDAGRTLTLILPVGPTGQYPYLLHIVHERKLALQHCHLFFMDEYCDSHGRPLPPTHPLSFRGAIDRLFFSQLDSSLAPPASQIIFPTPDNVEDIPQRIHHLGGIEVCYGGVGIHGHVAFNEPEPGVAETDPRVVRLNDFTVTMNAIRAGVGGNIEGFPRLAATLGMRQILSSRRIVLAIRNGIPLDWANAVLRLALFGNSKDDYPVTHIRGRDYRILTDRDTLASPRHVI